MDGPRPFVVYGKTLAEARDKLGTVQQDVRCWT
jgi:hypothetical protein